MENKTKRLWATWQGNLEGALKPWTIPPGPKWLDFYTPPASQVALEVKNQPVHAADARDWGSIPGSEISPGEGNGNPVFLPGKTHGQRSLGAMVHKVTKSHT